MFIFVQNQTNINIFIYFINSSFFCLLSQIPSALFKYCRTVSAGKLCPPLYAPLFSQIFLYPLTFDLLFKAQGRRLHLDASR